MSEENKLYLVIGAASGVGRSIALSLAQLGFDLVITSRSQRDISITADDLVSRFHKVKVLAKELDLTNYESVSSFIKWILDNNSQNFAGVYCCAGYSTEADSGVSQSNKVIDLLIDSNYKGIIHLLNPLLSVFEKRNFGLVSVISSIATASPRGKNNVYGSAKAGLEYYFRALQHYYADKSVNIQIYLLGYVDTSLSYGQKLLFPVAKPEKIAAQIVKNRNKKTVRIKYLPGYWFLITSVLRNLPWFIYKKLKF